jgi:hypothetical protein
LGPFLQQRVLKTVAAASRAFMRLDDDGLRA